MAIPVSLTPGLVYDAILANWLFPEKPPGVILSGDQSRLGLTMDSINDLKGNPGISGLHIYVGTNISEIDYFLGLL